MIKKPMKFAINKWAFVFNGRNVVNTSNGDITNTITSRLIQTRLINNNCINRKYAQQLVRSKYSPLVADSNRSILNLQALSFCGHQSLISQKSHVTMSTVVSRSFSTKQPKKEDDEELIIKIDGFKEDRLVKVGARTRLKLLARDYGSAVFVVHIGLSLTSLGTIYTLMKVGLPVESIVDPEAFSILGFGIDKHVDKIAAGGTFVMAYAVHKMIMPFRIMATCALVPMLVKFARRKGWLSPISPPPKP